MLKHLGGANLGQNGPRCNQKTEQEKLEDSAAKKKVRWQKKNSQSSTVDNSPLLRLKNCHDRASLHTERNVLPSFMQKWVTGHFGPYPNRPIQFRPTGIIMYNWYV